MTTTALPTTIRPGDFFHESWGYDQTNADFYQVTRISASGKTVWLRHVASAAVKTSDYGAYLAPIADHFDRDEDTGRSRSGELKRQLRVTDYGIFVNMTSYSVAKLWDCKPQWETGAAFGH